MAPRRAAQQSGNTRKTRTKKAAAPAVSAKRGRGRPEKLPTETEIKLVEQMAITGLTKRAMAAKLGIDIKTFDKHGEKYYFPAIERGHADGALLSGMTLVQLIKGKSLNAIMYYEKTRLGINEKTHLVVSSPDGSALPAAVTQVSVGLFLPPNGRDVAAPGQEIPASYQVLSLPANGRES